MPSSHPVSVANRQRRLKVDTLALRRLAGRVLEAEGAPLGAGIELVFLRDEAMARLNAEYRHREGPTDVLSFAYETGPPAGAEPLCDPGAAAPEARAAAPVAHESNSRATVQEPAIFGSVVVSVDRALTQAQERAQAVDEELARLVVHGVLHLMGYDDERSSDRRRMRRREDHYLKTRTEGR